MKHSARMQRIITALAKKHGLDLSRHGEVLRLEMPHYDALVVEVLHEHLVSVAHVYAPHPGVRQADPGIVFFTGEGGWIPIEINQRIGGYRIYAALSTYLDEIVGLLPREQANLADFAEMWAQNLEEQEWLAAGRAVREADEAIEPAIVEPAARAPWPQPTVPVPDLEQIEAWMWEDGGCEATDACWVEIDGVCPHGHPSWMLRLGLV